LTESPVDPDLSGVRSAPDPQTDRRGLGPNSSAAEQIVPTPTRPRNRAPGASARQANATHSDTARFLEWIHPSERLERPQNAWHFCEIRGHQVRRTRALDPPDQLSLLALTKASPSLPAFGSIVKSPGLRVRTKQR